VTDNSEPIRVLIVDDHEVVRRGLRGFLELQDDMEVVGEASDGAIAISLADSLEPDVVLMDLMMPNVDGLTAIASIRQSHPTTDIVAVTSFIEEDKVTAALEAGASGYLLKDASADEVADAIRAAFAGEVHLDPQVARVLAQRMRARRDEVPTEALTPREMEVLQLLARGAANKAIAADLSITERTARTHVSNILGKLGLASRTQAALWAVEHKMLDSA
jgi:DNA-binding NarL/FixJ family response regulator